MTYTSREVYELISRQTNDPIIERKTCAVSGQEFAIYQSDLEFFVAKFGIAVDNTTFRFPINTLSPYKKLERMLLWRNESKLKRTICAKSGKPLISIFGSDSGIVVWDSELRWSDEFDGLEYGLNFDFSKNFTENFKRLLHTVPFPNLYHGLSENSYYCNHTAHMKNCYMTYASFNDENTLYSSKTWDIKDSLDLLDCNNCNNCYQCINCTDGYTLSFCNSTSNCIDCRYLFNSQNCKHCIGCWNLSHKEFCIFNEQYTKDEYYRKYEALMEKGHMYIYTLRLSHQHAWVVPQFNLINCENVIGDKVTNSRNCFMCFNIEDMEHCKRCENGKEKLTDTYFAFGCGIHSSKNYQVVDTGGNGNNFYITLVVHYCTDIAYSMNCHNSQNLFGCIGLRNKQYCILNKQYTKDAYEITVAKIIAHMQETGERGEFFHGSLSPFGYNETVAQEYFPLTREEALARGYTRQDNNYDPVIPRGTNIVDRKTDIAEPTLDEEIIKSIFLCEVSSRPYRIIKQELEFYRKHHLPLPRKHPDVRHQERMNLRPGRTLYLRNCDKTGEQILSVYPPDYPGKVYSEKAYLAEVYS